MARLGPRKPDQPEIACNFEANIGLAPKQARVDQDSPRLTQKGLCECAEWLACGVENAVAPIRSIQPVQTRWVEEYRLAFGGIKSMKYRDRWQPNHSGTTASNILGK